MAVRSISLIRTSSKPVLIYGLIDPCTNELRYVGKTVNPRHRLKCHIGDARRGAKSYHANWVRSCIACGAPPQMMELEIVPPGDDWIDAEQFWIANARFLGCNLTNLCEGGQGTDGYRFLPDQIERLRQAHAGQRPLTEEQMARRRATMAAKRAAGWKKKSHPPESVERGVATRMARLEAGLIRTRKGVLATPETKAKISAAKKGTKPSAEARAKMSAFQRAKIVSPETCAAISRAKKGQKFTPQALANMLAGQRRRRAREDALGIPRAPRPSDEQIARLIAGRRCYAERQRAAKEQK